MPNPPPPSEKTVAAALQTLGLEPSAPWHEIRGRYRDLIRLAHPDMERTDPAATTRAVGVNVAFDVLAAATSNGTRPLPPVPVRVPADNLAPSPSAAVTLEAGPGDVFVQLLDAAHVIGDVSYMDPEAGLIQVLLDGGDPCSAQLLIAVDQHAEPPTASFTLDSQNASTAPPIRSIVDELAAAIKG